MVKSIIKRIIVGVGIALCLMYIKGGLVADVQAMEVHRSIPSGFGYSNSWASNATSISNIETFTPSNIQVPFYGYTFTNNNIDTNRAYIYWHFGSGNNDLDISTPLDVHFIIYHGFLNSQFDNNSVQVFLRNNFNNNALTYACTTNTQADLTHSDTQTSTFGYFTTVHCDNVAFSTQNFRVMMISNFRLFQSGSVPVGISGVSLYPHSTNNQVVNAIDENTQATEDVNNSINDETDADTGGFLEDIGQDYSNNPVSDLITMPITFLQRLNNNANGSCITWNLGSLFGTNLTMPCIDLQNILGSWLYNLIDMAICLFLAYNIGLMCITIWNNMTSLKDDFDDMYSPRHAYNGKHTGGDS